MKLSDNFDRCFTDKYAEFIRVVRVMSFKGKQSDVTLRSLSNYSFLNWHIRFISILHMKLSDNFDRCFTDKYAEFIWLVRVMSFKVKQSDVTLRSINATAFRLNVNKVT